MKTICCQKKAELKFVEQNHGVSRAEMLPDMVKGVHTYKCRVEAGSILNLETFSDCTQIYYFTCGKGFIVTSDEAYNIQEPSVFIPNTEHELNELHAVTDMEFLQLVCVMLPEDHEKFNKWHITLPRFSPTSQSIQYIEGFRPETIKAYSILDTDFLTRMTMGAIKGIGPNKAEPHSHHNLYQWYYGMPGTKFIYKAAGEEIELCEGDFAFIPADIEHAIEVKEGECVNYVWFEIELTKDEMEQKKMKK